MNRILRHLLLLAALLLPLEAWLNVEWRQLIGADLRLYLADMARPTARTRVLIVGDSHPHNAFLHAVLPDSIANVSFGSESLRDMQLKLRALLARGVRVRTLVVSADDHVFSPYREITNNEQSVMLGPDVTVDDYNLVYGRSMSGLKKLAVMHYPLIDLQNRNILTVLLLEKYGHRPAPPPAPTTRVPAVAAKPAPPASWATLDSAARWRVANGRVISQFGDDFQLSTTLSHTWGQILAICRANGIRVVAVRYPVTNEYRARLARLDLRPLRAMLRELPPDTILDYSTLYADQPANFADSDHLSTAGAEVFVPRFLADLRASGQGARAVR